MKGLILEIFKSIKNYKILVWIFILLVMMLILFYPIIDINFLYYKRVNNRINILEKFSNLNLEKIQNEYLSNEYNSILV